MDERIVPKSVADLFRAGAAKFGDLPAFASREKGKDFQFTSYRELYEIGLNLATALIDLGVSARDHVGLLADNRLEWIFADCGILIAGAADVPRGTDITGDEIRYILEHADCQVAFVENRKVLDRARQSQPAGVTTWILMDPASEAADDEFTLRGLIERGMALRESGDRRAEARLDAIQPDDLFTLIYTSGTTGTPKGVQLTHANMVSQIVNLPFPLELGGRALSILPIWHSYERVFEMLTMSWGVCTYYTSLRTVSDDLKVVKPTFMASAPRLWESVYTRIFSKIKSAPAATRILFKIAYTSAVRVQRARRFFMGQQLDTTGRGVIESGALAVVHSFNLIAYSVPYAVLDKAVLSKMRAIVGGAFQFTISGGGALQPHVDEFFNFIGIPVLEGYGLTETAPVLAVRSLDHLVIGTVGPMYPKAEVRIVSLDTQEILYPDANRRGRGMGLRGEIHVRGPQVMKGYYKDPENTARVLKDGWFNTGDIGMVTFNGCLKILGRSKDTIVLLSGENVEPVPIENAVSRSHLIEQCMVVGQDQKFLALLVVPSVEEFEKIGIRASDRAALAELPEAKPALDAEIRRLVSAETGFKPFERLGDWRFVPKPFEVGDELTATLKIRRHVVTDRYADLISEIYQ